MYIPKCSNAVDGAWEKKPDGEAAHFSPSCLDSKSRLTEKEREGEREREFFLKIKISNLHSWHSLREFLCFLGKTGKKIFREKPSMS